MSKINFNKMGFPEEYGLYDPKMSTKIVVLVL